ncbi:MAG: UxaA family hydrolase [Halobacteriales archaeon]
MSALEGFERSGRAPGVRNHVLVLPSVICSHEVAERIAAAVPGARAAPHDHGCAQIGADNEQTRRTFLGVAANPNVAGAVVVGLGCEAVQSDGVADAIDDLGVPVRELSIQGVGGTDECIEAGIATAEELADHARETRRRPVDLGDLTLGIVSGDLRDTTVERADPLVGDLARAVEDAGGRVVAAGIERLVPHREAALGSADGAGNLAAVLEDHADRPARASRVGRAAAEREFADVTRAWGGLPIRDVLAYGERADHDGGLAVLDAPSRFEEAATGLVAAGAQVIVHATAEGVPTGHPIAPVLKVSGDPATVEALGPDIDVDATSSGSEDLRERVESVVAGAPTRAEEHGLTSFAITRVGPSM